MGWIGSTKEELLSMHEVAGATRAALQKPALAMGWAAVYEKRQEKNGSGGLAASGGNE